VYALTALSISGEESVVSNTVSSTDTALLSWTAATGAIKYNIYKQVSGLYGFAFQVGAVTSFTLSSITPDYSKSPPVAQDYFPSANNYPGCSSFYQQRLLFGRTNNEPQTVWGTNTGNPFSFNVHSPVQADDAFKLTINDRKVNEIKSIVSMPLGNILGTSSAVISMNASQDEILTPTNTQFKFSERRWGMNDMRPIVVGNRVIYFDYSSARCRDLYYEISAYGYQGSEVSQWARHLFKDTKAIEWDFAAYPDSIAWIVCDDGTLKGLSYQRELNASDFVAWHRHDTDGSFESVASIPDANGGTEVWFSVKRTVNGSTVRYIERLSSREFDTIYDAWFVDCGIKYDSPITITGITQANPGVVTAPAHGLANNDTVIFRDLVGMDNLESSGTTINKYYKVANSTTNTFTLVDINTGVDINTTSFTAYVSGGTVRKCITTASGFNHLEGKSIDLLCDGRVVQGLTVASGSVTLPNPAGVIIGGLPYLSEGQPLAYEFAAPTGTLQDKTRQIRSLYVSVQNTRAVSFAPDANRKAYSAKLTTGGLWANPVPLYTGEIEVQIEAGDTRSGTVYFKVDKPLPCTIRRIIARLQEGVY